MQSILDPTWPFLPLIVLPEIHLNNDAYIAKMYYVFSYFNPETRKLTTFHLTFNYYWI